MSETKGKSNPLVTSIGQNTTQPIRPGDGLADVATKIHAQNKYILTGRDRTRKPGQSREMGAEGMHPYHQANIIRKTGLGELAAKRIIEGDGIFNSLKGAFKDKMNARAMGVKETFNLLNIIKTLSFGSKFITAAAGKALKRDARDIEYFSGVKVPTATRLRKVQEENDDNHFDEMSGNKLNKNSSSTLGKIYSLLNGSNNQAGFQEEAKFEEQKDRDIKHKQIFDSLQEMIKLLKKLTLTKDDKGLSLPGILPTALPKTPPKGNTTTRTKTSGNMTKSDINKLEKAGAKFNQRTGRWHNTNPGQRNRIIGSSEMELLLKESKMSKLGGGLLKGLNYLTLPMLGYDIYSANQEFKNSEETYGGMDPESLSNIKKEKSRTLLNSANPFIPNSMDVDEAESWIKKRTFSKINEPSKPNDRVALALKFFQSPEGGGWTSEQAQGIIGNLQHESGSLALNTSAIGDGGKAYGLAQWHPDRQDIFEQVMGKSIRGSSLLDQLKFVNYELHSNESRAGSLLRQAKSAKQSADIMMDYYERPSAESKIKSRETRRDLSEKLSMYQTAPTLNPSGPNSSKVNNLVNENVSLKMDKSSGASAAPVIINKTNNVAGGSKSQVASKSVTRNDDPTLHQLQYQNLDRARV